MLEHPLADTDRQIAVSNSSLFIVVSPRVGELFSYQGDCGSSNSTSPVMMCKRNRLIFSALRFLFDRNAGTICYILTSLAVRPFDHGASSGIISLIMPTRTTFLRRLTTVAIVAVLLTVCRASQGSEPCPQRCDGRWWLVNTRDVDCCENRGVPRFHRHDCDGLHPASADAFFSSLRADDILVIYVHGNRIDEQYALQRGRAYDKILSDYGDGPHIKFLVWSWPADRIKGQIRDIRVKAARTDCEARILADFLGQVPPHVRLSLIGFSYGARIISGALHLQGRYRAGLNARVAMLAAAVHSEWLAPGAEHGRAMLETNRLLLICNSCDRVLKRYRVVEKRGRPTALGYTGIDYRLPAGGGTLKQVDVCCRVGKRHDECRYLNIPEIAGPVARHSLWLD